MQATRSSFAPLLEAGSIEASGLEGDDELEGMRDALVLAWDKAHGGCEAAWRGLRAGALLVDLGYAHEDIIGGALLGGMLADGSLTVEEAEEQAGESVARAAHRASRVIGLRNESGALEEGRAKELRLFCIGLHGGKAAVSALADRVQAYEVPGEQAAGDERSRLGVEGVVLYGPLASALGEKELGERMERAAMELLLPASFSGLEEHRANDEEGDLEALQEAQEMLTRVFREEGLEVTLKGRRKSSTSAMRKLLKDGRDYGQVRDIIGLRAVVSGSEHECYRALEASHRALHQVPGRLKDYVRWPKGSYRSIHTTLRARNGRELELQVRTQEMDREAEAGLASHTAYKAGADSQRQAQLFSSMSAES